MQGLLSVEEELEGEGLWLLFPLRGGHSPGPMRVHGPMSPDMHWS